ncbi:MAG: chalcone isomerase family protein [Candidatus Krumholzibacteria bacterium]|nr:chalcone isomerase family protein [Candidatus Krumholzibacteria bacterium]
MNKFAHIASLFVLLVLLLPLTAGAIVEPGTKMAYDDTVSIDSEAGNYDLIVTGVGLREKTFMKVNVYVIVSYVIEGAELEGDQGVALLNLDVPKMIKMDLVRGFSREKLVNAFKDVIEKNYDDMSAFQADMDEFFAYFTDDAQDGDELIFTYIPGLGLKTALNGEDKGLITNFEFVKALWTVWFGEEPANDGLKKDLLEKIAS